jgi:hypothetical protein
VGVDGRSEAVPLEYPVPQMNLEMLAARQARV